MRNTSCQLPNSRHFLRLNELALKPFVAFLLIAQRFLAGLDKKIRNM